MKPARSLAAVVFLVTLACGCATTSTTATTWTDPSAAPPGYGYGYAYPYGRPGQVYSVREVVRRTEGNPAGGAVAGAVLGALAFGGRGPDAVAGAIGGAALGAAASQGSSETRTYEVVVRFDDGAYATFVYAASSPFGPGQRVVLTQQGLAPG